jgi:hypothetical protein
VKATAFTFGGERVFASPSAFCFTFFLVGGGVCRCRWLPPLVCPLVALALVPPLEIPCGAPLLVSLTVVVVAVVWSGSVRVPLPRRCSRSPQSDWHGTCACHSSLKAFRGQVWLSSLPLHTSLLLPPCLRQGLLSDVYPRKHLIVPVTVSMRGLIRPTFIFYLLLSTIKPTTAR